MNKVSGLRLEVLNNIDLFYGEVIQGYGFYLYFKESIDPLHFCKEHGKVFYDEVSQKLYTTSRDDEEGLIEVSYLPGVKDNSAEVLQDLLLSRGVRAEVKSFRLFSYPKLKGQSGESLCQYYYQDYANLLIEQVHFYSKEQTNLRFLEITRDSGKSIRNPTIVYEDLNKSDLELIELSTERCLALTLDELKVIKAHYAEAEVLKERQARGLKASPTDLELEVLAQTWSEHCKHKIFNAQIDYHDEIKNEHSEIKSLFKSYIKQATQKNHKPWLESVFVDNSGIISLDQDTCVCMKVETHNSPSALDPYGGAITGILGVNRDILGTGMGAKPIANTDIFCFAPPDFLDEVEHKKHFPPELLNPRRILTGVHRGVVDGGNKSGIPTINGSFHFDPDYAGKPLVYVGTIGVLPKKLMSGKLATKGKANVGDLIVMVGGDIGADGIHGATFSSLELNQNSPTSAVQIGDAFTQKKVVDFILRARDLELYSALTDNGAGGLSSSVGEMSQMTGGAKIDLALAPTKYSGLLPWQLMVSESQERMTVAVPSSLINDFLNLSKEYNVRSTVLGEFTASGYLEVFYAETLYGHLNLHFLHEGLPPMKLKARWTGSLEQKTWSTATPNFRTLKLKKIDEENIDWQDVCEKVLSAPNVKSKENLVRIYDHEVGGLTAIKPYQGLSTQAPSSAGALWLGSYSKDNNLALVTGNGLAPKLSQHDPYLMSQYALDEAVRNMVCHGGDIEHMALLDNFCWPDPVLSEKNPDGDLKLGALVRSCQGLYEACLEYKLPLISGKDSMKNDYLKRVNGENILKISILPTLLVSGFAKADIRFLMNSNFQQEGDLIYLAGEVGDGLKHSELSSIFKSSHKAFEKVSPINLKKNFKLYKCVQALARQRLLKSCQDISEGGLFTALYEASDIFSFNIELSADPLLSLFNEGAGQMLISLDKSHQKAFEEILNNQEITYTHLGSVTKNSHALIKTKNEQIRLDLASLKNAYQGGLLC
jgi:phosphoribosylformylglycinamidine synthase subunit PurSL